MHLKKISHPQKWETACPEMMNEGRESIGKLITG